jgi:hypothetical protein
MCAFRLAAHTSNSLAGYHYDYSDSFAAETATEDDLGPEQLARAVLEGAPRPVRWLLLAGFRYGLNLRLASLRSAESSPACCDAQPAPPFEEPVALRLCPPPPKTIGTAGFEPTTPCSQSRCATRLRHVPYTIRIGVSRPPVEPPLMTPPAE